MRFRLGDLPQDLVLALATFLDDASLANFSQPCKDLHQLLTPEMTRRAQRIALAPRAMYEQRYVYTDDQTAGVDEPVFVEEHARLGHAPRKEDVFGEAVLAGKLDTVKFFLRAGVNPNTYILDGTRMLSLAVQSTNILMVKLLLEFGANPRLKDLVLDMSPLAHAARSWQDDMVELLINANGDLSEFSVLGRIVYACSAHAIEMCISRGADFAAVSVADYTVLHHIVTRNEQAIFDLVMPHFPATLLNAVTQTGRTALHLAMLNKNPHLAWPLLALGVDVNVQDNLGYTALHLALKKRHLSLARNLLQNGCRINLVNHDGETELHLAIQARQPDMVRMLLDINADVDAHTPHTGTPLHFAVHTRDAAMVRILLEGPASPDLEIEDFNGRTALQEAQDLGEAGIAQLLCERVYG